MKDQREESAEEYIHQQANADDDSRISETKEVLVSDEQPEINMNEED